MTYLCLAPRAITYAKNILLKKHYTHSLPFSYFLK